jgi:hypothetical protein
MLNFNWLDKYIEEQESQKENITQIIGNLDFAELQEQAEFEGWGGEEIIKGEIYVSY